eukprot:EG_transcript_15951
MVSLGRRLCLVFPTLLTLGALGCGLTAILNAIDGYFWRSYWFLFASAILDGLDGHAARALKATSAIGAELDSLCDLVDFGVSPAFVLLMWARHAGPRPAAWYEEDHVVWGCFLAYVSGCAYRLARFNLDDKVPVLHPPHSTTFKSLDGTGEAKSSAVNFNAADLPPSSPCSPVVPSKKWLDQYVNRSKFFQGIPAPAAALVSLMPMVYWLQYASTEHDAVPLRPRSVVPVVYVVVAALMVGRFRTFSSKMLIKGPVHPQDPRTSHLRSRNKFTLVLKVAAAAGFLYIYTHHPYKVHMIATTMYLLTLPFSHFVYSYLLTEPEKTH